MFARPYVCSICRRPTVARLLKLPQSQYLHASYPLGLPRRKDFFSSNAFLSQKQSRNGDLSEELSSETQKQRKRGARNPAAPTSLRRVAVEAQRSKDGFLSKAQLKEQGLYQTKVSTAGALKQASAADIGLKGSNSLCCSRTIRHPQSQRYPPRERFRAGSVSNRPFSSSRPYPSSHRFDPTRE